MAISVHIYLQALTIILKSLCKQVEIFLIFKLMLILHQFYKKLTRHTNSYIDLLVPFLIFKKHLSYWFIPSSCHYTSLWFQYKYLDSHSKLSFNQNENCMIFKSGSWFRWTISRFFHNWKCYRGKDSCQRIENKLYF